MDWGLARVLGERTCTTPRSTSTYRRRAWCTRPPGRGGRDARFAAEISMADGDIPGHAAVHASRAGEAPGAHRPGRGRTDWRCLLFSPLCPVLARQRPLSPQIIWRCDGWCRRSRILRSSLRISRWSRGDREKGDGSRDRRATLDMGALAEDLRAYLEAPRRAAPSDHRAAQVGSNAIARQAPLGPARRRRGGRRLRWAWQER